MDAMEAWIVKDSIEYASPEEQQKRRDNIRAELIRYNEEGTGSTGQQTYQGPTSTADYLEPTNDGYAGLEGPLG